ncbi:hypothetical protein [Myxacorys almedinensis]|uniref:Uncharacterized protein n=1 Tax=Myxacorys almedinensis A TaxID=2690445 RepID=A0A8J7Z5N7_9CYAN|nr:hypothetical protein [Myxacorys almedinensis]NDJ15945.1 hypothetical protein [Myxacorys almedinensis A]
MKSMLKKVRALLVVSICALLVFLTVIPPAAIATPMKGEASETAKIYEQTAVDAINEGGPKSLDKIQERQSGGLNEIQGTAGFDQQKRPSNSQGDTIESKIKRGLDKAESKSKDAVESAKDVVR